MAKGTMGFYVVDRARDTYGYIVQNVDGKTIASDNGLTRNELLKVARRYDSFFYTPEFGAFPKGLQDELLKTLRR